MNRGCKIQAWNLWSKSTASDASSVCKAHGPGTKVHYARVQRIPSQSFLNGANSQEMGAPVRLQKKVKKMNLFKRYQNWNSVGLKISWQNQEVIPARPLLKVELSASKCRHKRCSRRRFLLLKSLDSGNLLERLNRSLKALGHLRPWRQAPGKVLEEGIISQSTRSQKKKV